MPFDLVTLLVAIHRMSAFGFMFRSSVALTCYIPIIAQEYQSEFRTDFFNLFSVLLFFANYE